MSTVQECETESAPPPTRTAKLCAPTCKSRTWTRMNNKSTSRCSIRKYRSYKDLQTDQTVRFNKTRYCFFNSFNRFINFHIFVFNNFLYNSLFNNLSIPQVQILTLMHSSSRDIEAPIRPIIISSTTCRRDIEIGIAISPVPSVSPPKRGPKDVAIFSSCNCSV